MTIAIKRTTPIDKRLAFYADLSGANCAVGLVHDALQVIEDAMERANTAP